MSLDKITRLEKQYETQGHLYNMPRSDRPKVTTDSDEKHIYGLMHRSQVASAADLKRRYY